MATVAQSSPSKGRRVAVLGAASSIGLRPYDSGREARHLDLAPAALREHGLLTRLRAEDLGDVKPAPYRDFVRPPGGVRNEEALVAYSHAIAKHVREAIADERFGLLLGGDCSIVLGALLGVNQLGRVGLAYIDAHADFCTPDESQTGSAASMCLALAVGRGESPLAKLADPAPLVNAGDVVLIGRRDAGQSYGHAGLASSGICDIPGDTVSRMGAGAAATAALGRLARPEMAGFWIHVDADVLDPAVMPAVDSPEPDGLSLDGLTELVAPLARHPRALGLQLTIFDPALDPDGSCAERLTMLLQRILIPLAPG